MAKTQKNKKGNKKNKKGCVKGKSGFAENWTEYSTLSEYLWNRCNVWNLPGQLLRSGPELFSSNLREDQALITEQENVQQVGKEPENVPESPSISPRYQKEK